MPGFGAYCIEIEGCIWLHEICFAVGCRVRQLGIEAPPACEVLSQLTSIASSLQELDATSSFLPVSNLSSLCKAAADLQSRTAAALKTKAQCLAQELESISTIVESLLSNSHPK
jgi:hypothetical protein